jgi:predicted ATPase
MRQRGSWVSPLCISLFGPMELRRNGERLPPLRRRKGYRLLALLALRAGSEVERSWLAGVLWPDSSESQALANLRNCLKDLRRALGSEDDCLSSHSPQTLSLDPSAVLADVHLFDAVIARGDERAWEWAVTLYRGPLLEGCTEEWAFRERQIREQMCLRALDALAARALERGDPAAAEPYLRRASNSRSRVEPNAALPSSRTGSVRSHNLPAQVTPLFGRDRDVEAVRALLQREGTRLLTITGPGGIGKTRLAVESAAGLLAEYTDGVFFVALAPIRDPTLVVSTIAQTLGVREASGRPVSEALEEHLRPKQLLLLVDNFEQVTAAGPQLSGLLSAAPRLKLLVTSRVALRLHGEQEYLVPPLSLPDLKRLPPVELLSKCAAVEMFIQRALGVKPQFRLTNENAAAVAQICHRLDGLPLAIELAAAWIRLLPPQELLSRLGGASVSAAGLERYPASSLRLLVAGARDLPDRLQTLRATIAWSYNLLDEDVKGLFRRLSLFVGGFTLEAALAIGCTESTDEFNLLNGIESLLTHNLIREQDGVGGEPRFTMLEMIREYGQEELAACGEAADRRRAHAQFVLALAEAAELHDAHAERGIWLDRLEAEHDNLRAALAWSAGHDETETGLRLAGALLSLWWVRGHLSEGRAWIDRLLALQGVDARTAVRAKALNTAGILARRQGDLAVARQFLGESLAIGRELGDRWHVGALLAEIGYVTLCEGDRKSAEALLKESLKVNREVDNKPEVAGALGNLGHIARLQGDWDTARALYAEGLSIRKRLRDQHGIARSFQNLALLALDQGDYGTARARWEAALATNRELGFRSGQAENLQGLGRLAYLLGDLKAAQNLLDEALEIGRELNDKPVIVGSLWNLGLVARALGDERAVWTFRRQNLPLLQEMDDRARLAEALAEFAALARERGQLKRTVRLWAVSDALRGETADAPPLWDERAVRVGQVAAVRAELGEPLFQSAWAEGQLMPVDDAVRYALEENETASPL